MSVLDSRALTYLDCFGQQFTVPGKVRYGVGGPVAAFVADRNDLPFTITVGEAKGNGDASQHDVDVDFVNGSFTAEPRELSIAAGDVVVWHTSSPAAPPYGVWGEGDAEPFSSGDLRAGSFYSHAFVAPGEASWANAKDGLVLGTVRVRDVDRDDQAQSADWARALEKGSVVVIQRDRVEPAELEILAGQTVFFAVSDSEGITVTDSAVTELTQASIARLGKP